MATRLFYRVMSIARSTRVAIALISYLAVALAAATFWDSRGFYRSPWFLVPAGLFELNLLLCTIHRLRAGLVGSKPARIGPDVIHIGLLFLVVGGLISLVAMEEGTVLLGEGQGVLVGGRHRVVLREFSVVLDEGGGVANYVSTLSVADTTGSRPARTISVRVNRPARIGRVRIYQDSYAAEVSDAARSPDTAVYVSGLRVVDDPGAVTILAAAVVVVLGLVLTYGAPGFVAGRERR